MILNNVLSEKIISFYFRLKFRTKKIGNMFNLSVVAYIIYK